MRVTANNHVYTIECRSQFEVIGVLIVGHKDDFIHTHARQFINGLLCCCGLVREGSAVIRAG